MDSFKPLLGKAATGASLTRAEQEAFTDFPKGVYDEVAAERAALGVLNVWRAPRRRAA